MRYDGVGFGGVAYGDNSFNETFGAIVNPNGFLTAQGWGTANDFHTTTAGTSEGWLIQEIVLTAGTCLLYTSPSPRDQRGSRMPSSA